MAPAARRYDKAPGSIHSSQLGAVGSVTRGTTHLQRLRRCDRWMVHHPAIRTLLTSTTHPLVVDVGYGASDATCVEMAQRLRSIRDDIAVAGLEIDPTRVGPPREGVQFYQGGFELAGLTPHLVRAFNVLRQYPEQSVRTAWNTMLDNAAPGALVVEGTCDELGRRCSWVVLDASGPQEFTLAWDPHDVGYPSELSARLIKSLIHHNVPGQRIHGLLNDCDKAWEESAFYAVYGPRVRWRESLARLRAWGYPISVPRRRLRDNLLTVPWECVAPS